MFGWFKRKSKEPVKLDVRKVEVGITLTDGTKLKETETGTYSICMGYYYAICADEIIKERAKHPIGWWHKTTFYPWHTVKSVEILSDVPHEVVVDEG
jgi:hypothetical protein